MAPYLGIWFCMVVSGIWGDKLRTRGVLQTTAVRKVMQIIGRLVKQIRYKRLCGQKTVSGINDRNEKRLFMGKRTAARKHCFRYKVVTVVRKKPISGMNLCREKILFQVLITVVRKDYFRYEGL